MTALERALVVYAEAKGYEVEYLHKDNIQWNIKDTAGFNFEHFKYRIMNKKDYRKVYDELSDFFKPITPEHDRTWKIEDLIKYDAPEGFFCKSVLITQKEIEEMDKPKKSPFETDSPEVRGRYAKVTPFILLMEAWAEGEKDIEFAWKSESSPKWTKTDDPYWNFDDVIYRAVPKTKQPEAIPVTEEELEEIKAEKNSCFWVKDKTSGITWKFSQMGVDILESFYIFNPVSKCWQDWNEK